MVTISRGAQAGRSFSGWTEASITRTLDQVSGRFTLSIGGDLPGVPLAPGDEVQLSWKGWQMLTGYVDEVAATIAPEGRTIRVAGRDRTADLVDCSADVSPGEYSDITLVELAENLLQPFGIELDRQGADFTLFDAGSAPRFAKFQIQRGESPFAAIERGAREQGVLLFSTREGRLRIATAGERPTYADLVQGGKGANVLEARFTHSNANRFATYRVLAQTSGSPETFGAAAAHVEGVAEDLGVDRFRPLVVIAERQLSPFYARRRAQWEATVRAARASQLVAQVQGWERRPEEEPWTLNQIAPTRIQALGIDAGLLIDGVTFRTGPEGRTTSLRLTRPDAYNPQPQVPSDSESFGTFFGSTGEAT